MPLDASVRVIPSSTVVPLAELVPSEPGPWALINGAFYDEALEALGLVVGDGTEHSPLARGGGSGVFILVRTGGSSGGSARLPSAPGARGRRSSATSPRFSAEA